MTWYEHTYEVVGSARFPIDMLRYETSVPATSADAAVITASVMRKQKEVKRITLSCLTPDPHWRPAADRWRRLGWEVGNHQKRGRDIGRTFRPSQDSSE